MFGSRCKNVSRAHSFDDNGPEQVALPYLSATFMEIGGGLLLPPAFG
jgi:hypothetical protein